MLLKFCFSLGDCLFSQGSLSRILKAKGKIILSLLG